MIPDFNLVLPSDEFAERALLGSMLIDNRYVNEVFSTLNSEDFYIDSNKKIAAAIVFLINKGEPVDIITISEFLKRKKELKFVGGYDYINSLTDGIPQKLNISEYIKIVKDRSSLRKIIITSMGVIQKGVENKTETESILNELQEDIIKISERRIKKGFLHSGELIKSTLDEVESIQKIGESGGLKTGFSELDNITSGFQKGELIIIAARPSMGKTALALNIASKIAIDSEKSVAFFSIEMSRIQIMMRLIALETKINISALRTGKPHLNQKEWNDLELAASQLKKANLFIDDSASLSIIEMKTRARRLKNERGLDIVFVDYLQLIKASRDLVRRNDSRAQEVAVITASLKEMAKELEIPVVALAQLNRAPEQRGSRKLCACLMYLLIISLSEAIEQDADVVIILKKRSFSG